MKHLEKESEFNELIKKDLVLVDFYAQWCGPCQMMAKELEELAKENKDLEIVKVDIDKFPQLTEKHFIMLVPTLKVYKQGEETNKSTGYLTKDEIKNLLV